MHANETAREGRTLFRLCIERRSVQLAQSFIAQLSRSLTPSKPTFRWFCLADYKRLWTLPYFPLPYLSLWPCTYVFLTFFFFFFFFSYFNAISDRVHGDWFLPVCACRVTLVVAAERASRRRRKRRTTTQIMQTRTKQQPTLATRQPQQHQQRQQRVNQKPTSEGSVSPVQWESA